MDLRENVEDAGASIVPRELDLRKRFLVDERVHFGRAQNFFNAQKPLIYQFISLGCRGRCREVASQGQHAHFEEFFSSGMEKQIATELGVLEGKETMGDYDVFGHKI